MVYVQKLGKMETILVHMSLVIVAATAMMYE